MLKRRAFILLSVAISLGAAPRLVHARCAPPRPYAELVTPLSSPLPIGANLVVQVRVGHEYGRGPEVTELPDGGGVAVQGLALVQGTTRIELTSESIGGGLVRLVPARPITAGTYSLTGFTRTQMSTGAVVATPLEVTFRGTLPPPVVAVAVTAARHAERSEGQSRWGERTSYRTTFTIDSPLPPTIVRAAFVSRNEWIVVDRAEGRELVASGAYGGSHCGDGHIPGVGRPHAGLDVHLVLIDAFGRVVTSTQTTRIR